MRKLKIASTLMLLLASMLLLSCGRDEPSKERDLEGSKWATRLITPQDLLTPEAIAAINQLNPMILPAIKGGQMSLDFTSKTTVNLSVEIWSSGRQAKNGVECAYVVDDKDNIVFTVTNLHDQPSIPGFDNSEMEEQAKNTTLKGKIDFKKGVITIDISDQIEDQENKKKYLKTTSFEFIRQ
ncbi:MAG: hypothetical protein SPI72_02825 [Porphyromonas sp.]|nr:hypothetical protein [Porphyromonas sp.]